jgi:ABC-2 type transport system permease protein
MSGSPDGALASGEPRVAAQPAPAREKIAERALRQLFLTVFLRGRSARGIRRSRTPSSVASKLLLTLLVYALVGAVALIWLKQPLFVLSTCLHGMTFVFLGTFVAASAGELLFNKDEADILLHRPVAARSLLWAKIAVLVRVSLWLAAAFNLVGVFVGLSAPGVQPWFPLVHLLSTALVALLCTASVVLVYELCLRWFGRERLDGLITLAQIVVTLATVLLGQAPRLLMQHPEFISFAQSSWVLLLPPAWFAGLDVALAGHGGMASWAAGALAVAVTAGTLWLALGRLAHSYEHGLRVLGESSAQPASGGARSRFLHTLTTRGPGAWLLRDPVHRVTFLLALAYLARNRDTKLRVYPGTVPLLIMPFLILGRGGADRFGIAFAGAYLGLVPMFVLQLLQYSDNAAAAEVFRLAPLPGPGRLIAGARGAVLAFSVLPLLLMLGVFAWLTAGEPRQLLLLLPGLIALPVYAFMPSIGGQGLPLSQPSDAASAAGRGFFLLFSILFALALAGLATWAWSNDRFAAFLAVEALVAVGVHLALRRAAARAAWPSLE